MRTLSLSVLLLAAGPALAQKEFGFDNRKASGQPYLSPEETVKRMTVAPEFEVKLFAGEPQVMNPIAFTIDEKGRHWVVECFEYPSKTPPGKAPRDRIVILEDTDGDGACDKRTVFAEGKDFPVPEERKAKGLGAFDMASAIEVGHGGVYVGAPPYLWFIENKNDKPGKFETLLKGFGSEDTHETLNTFQWGPDGWLYGCHGIFTKSNVQSAQLDGPETRMNAAVWRFHPKTKKFEIFAEGTSNPWGLDWRNTDGQFILACCVIPHLYHIVPGGVYKRQAGASFNPYAYGQINEICDHTFHRESGWAHAGLLSLDVPHIPEKYRDSVIFGSIHGCSLKRNVLKPNGSTYTASRADDFLVSGDKNVRPINLRWGPGGDIFMIDWHDQNPCHQAKADSWDHERGRVYRIQVKGRQPTKAEDLGEKKPEELATLAGSDQPFVARTALRLLSELDQPMLDTAARSLRAQEQKRKSAPTPQLFRAGILSGQLRSAYRSGFTFPERKAATLPPEAATLLHALANGPEVSEFTVGGFVTVAQQSSSPALHRELASAAIRLADTHDVRPLLHALMQRKEDTADPLIPFLTWLAYEKVIAKHLADPAALGAELSWLDGQAPDNILVRDHIVPRVMRRLVATGQPADLALCLKFVADAKDTNTREKALSGLAVALDKQTVTPPDAWAALRPELAKDARLAPMADKLAVSFRDPKAIADAFAAVKDAKRSADDRAEAVRRLAALKPSEAAHLFVTLTQTDPVPAVRIEAARGLAAFDAATIAAQVLAAWKDYPPAVRSELVNTLAGRKPWAKQLLAAMQAKTVDRRDVTDNTILRIQAFKDKELDALIATAWGRTRPTPAELDAQIAKFRESLSSGPASFARGKVVFDNNCAKCHKFDGRGTEVGPPLDGAARDIEYLLANVIDPNRVIGAPYFLRVVKTEDGRVEQGLLAEEDDRSLTLKVENAVLKRFDKKNLDGPVQVLEKSMMPEGLTGGMSPQDFRDLVRYAMAHPFPPAVTVNGKVVTAPVTGRVALPKEPGDVVIAAEVTATDSIKTQLLVGSPGAFEVRLDGKSVGTGTGDDLRATPDRAAFPVELSKGTHKFELVVRHKGSGNAVFARLLDPDRKLAYQEPPAPAK